MIFSFKFYCLQTKPLSFVIQTFHQVCELNVERVSEGGYTIHFIVTTSLWNNNLEENFEHKF